MKLDGLEPQFFECLAGDPVEEMFGPENPPPPVTDARILGDYFASDPNAAKYWADATADERAQFLADKRQDPIYTMTPEAYAAYVRSQREMAAAQSGAGLSPAARADIMERAGFGEKKGIPLWVILAGTGAAAFFIFRKKAA